MARKLSRFIPVALTPEMLERVDRAAEARSITRSEFIRQAVELATQRTTYALRDCEPGWLVATRETTGIVTRARAAGWVTVVALGTGQELTLPEETQVRRVAPDTLYP